VLLLASHAIVNFISPAMIKSSANWNIDITIVTIDTITIFIRHSVNLLHFMTRWTIHLGFRWRLSGLLSWRLITSPTSRGGCSSCSLHAHHWLLHTHAHHRLLHSHAHHWLLHAHAHHWLLHTHAHAHWLLHRHHRCSHHATHGVVHWWHCTTSAHWTHTTLNLRLLRLLNWFLHFFWGFWLGFLNWWRRFVIS